ncbi:MAG: ATP-binding protein [Duodenibacillus sp.]|nr:ATP-binding protein [Duodenibacillus sp.]
MKLYRRERYLSRMRPFYDSAELIKVVTGLRRSGKSSLMRTAADELRERGVPEENLIFIDLDARAWRKLAAPDDLERAVDERSRAAGLKYLFIDEIQNVRGFEPVINALRGSGEYSIFITGSNSYLLSGELVTKLTGRYVQFEVFTLAFSEYLAMKAFYGKPAASPAEEFARYVQEGGLPGMLHLDDPQAKKLYAREIVTEILHKDIQSRVRIRNRSVFERVQDYIFNNFGATTSIHNIVQYFEREEGLRIKQTTILRYLEILENARVIYKCSRFDMKTKRSLRGDQKYYLGDLAFFYARNTDNRVNWGPVLENIFYLHARSLGLSASVGRIGRVYECDFVVRDFGNAYAYVQVSYALSSEKVQEREYRPFAHIRDGYPRWLLTMDPLCGGGEGVRHVNFVRFMAEEPPVTR